MKISHLAVAGILFTLPVSTLASHPESVQVRSMDGGIDFSYTVGDTVGGVSITMADLGDDGVSEIIIGGGMGSEPRVKVLRQDGSEIGSFLAYAPTLGVGVHVDACDLTGDGFNEIIVAPGRGGGPHIRVFNRFGIAIDNGGFFAYDESFRGGVNLACGNLLGDERSELVTLPGTGGGPHVRVWSWNNNGFEMMRNFFAFDADDQFGIVGDVDDMSLIISQQHTSAPIVKTFSLVDDLIIKSEKNISIDALGVHSLIVHQEKIMLSTSSNSWVYTLEGESVNVKSLHGSVALTSDDKNLLYTSGRLLFTKGLSKHINVDTSKQRLYAWSNGILDNSFLISSGLNNATPLGNHVILAKVPEVHYAWNYGEGNPNNYDLGWIPFNLRIYPHIYIHYAPWHNNFGHQMSHGCVNVSLEDMKWVYDWSDEGISVEVH